MDHPFGRWLRTKRLALGLTQVALARLAHCAPITVRKLEAGQRYPSIPLAQNLALALAIPIAERPAFMRAARGTAAPPTPDVAPLPIPLTPFIGQQQLVADVSEYITSPSVRLLTLTGPPGVGKTRLAQQVAALLKKSFLDGVSFVSLAALTDPALVLPHLMTSLGIRDDPAHRPLDQLIGSLRERQMLLLLDNFEHILPAAPPLGDLLASAPDLKLLVTSRERLHLYGEVEVIVPPLPVPTSDDLARPDLRYLADLPSLQLFTQRAQASRPTFRLDADALRPVAELCTRLEGLPLALELAAGGLKTLSPMALLARMTAPPHHSPTLTLLDGGAANLPPRQRTLRHAIEWSYSLLGEEEQGCFDTLGIFMGSFSLDAVVAMLTPDASDTPLPSAVPERLRSLTDKSLLQARGGDAREPRFALLESLHEYALAHLCARGSYPTLRERHAHYYLALAEQADRLLSGSDQTAWFARLETEHENLRAALAWSFSDGTPEIGIRLSTALSRFWWNRGYIAEGSHWLEKAEAHSATVAPLLRALVLNDVGNMAWAQGDYEAARRHHEASLAVREQAGCQKGMAASLNNLGNLALEQAEYPRSQSLYEASLAHYRTLDQPSGTAGVLGNLGLVAWYRQDYERAQHLQEESLCLYEKLGHERGMATARHHLARLALLRDDLTLATTLLAISLQAFERLGNTPGIAMSLEASAELASKTENPRRALILLGAAAALRHATHLPLSPVDAPPHEAILHHLQETLPLESFENAWHEGWSLTLPTTIAYALLAPHALDLPPAHLPAPVLLGPQGR